MPLSWQAALRLPPPRLLDFAFDTSARFYYIALVYTLLALAFLYALKSSRIGMVLKAIRQNDPLVESQGISPAPYKLAAFVIADSGIMIADSGVIAWTPGRPTHR